MLQDIAPHRFHIAMDRARESKDTDYLLCFQAGSVLTLPGKSLCFPHCEQHAPLQYLFSIDDTAFYLPVQGCAVPAGRWQPVSIFRQKGSDWLRFAGITAYHLWQWYRNNRFCGCCGQPMTTSATERTLVCSLCGDIRYPQIAPAIIAAVTDGNNLLLTRYQGSPHQKFSLVAGFCEVGESIEETVKREIREEVGLQVTNLRYYKSQPWPFSQSLLMGFFCDVTGSREIRTDLRELAEAHWYARENIPYHDEGLSLTGEMIQRFQQGKEPK